MKLLHQILLLVFCPLVIMGGIYLGQIEALLGRLDQSIKDRMQQSRMHFMEGLANILDHEARIVLLIDQDSLLGEALEVGDADTLFRKSRVVVDNVVDYLVFLDKDGIVISRGHDEFKFGDAFDDHGTVSRVLSGETVSGLGMLEDKVCLLYAQPVRLYDERIVGAVLLGVRLESYFQEYASIYPGEYLDFTLDGRVASSVLPKKELAHWDSIRFAVPLLEGGEVDVTLYQDHQKRRSQLSALRWNLLGLAAALALVLGIVVAFFVRWLVKPLKALITAMKAYSESQERLDVVPGQTKEVGELTQAFNLMVRHLEEKQASLEQTENKYRSIVENSLAGIYQSTVQGRFLSANPAMAELFDYESPERLITDVVDMKRQLYVRTEDWDKTRSLLLRDGFIKNLQLEYKRKDGKHIWISETMWLVRDEAGRILHIEGSIMDVTEVRRANELERQKIAAEAASNAKSQFLAAMSHEIRTPMNAIMGMVDLLNETTLTVEQRRYLHVFEEASDSLLALLGDILDISKVEAGQLRLEYVPVRLPDLLQSLLNVWEPRAGQKGLRLLSSVEEDVPDVVMGDPTRLRQVFMNLVGNAVKFTNTGEVSIRVEVDQGEAPSRAVKLRCAVRDTGIGISHEQLENIFERFTQADGSITRQYGGSGLGLAICRSLVELMGGRLWAESSKGQGSVFYFTVELRTCDALDREGKGAAPQILEEPSRPLRVLLVEDSDYNAFVVQAYLKKAPCIVDVAKNGRDGLARFTSGSYDLVLMDMHMPIMDGYSASSAIRAWEMDHGKARTSIVAMTAQAFVEDVERCLKAGCDLHLAKPLRKEHFFAELSRITSLRLHPDTEPRVERDYGRAVEAEPAPGPIQVAIDPDFIEIVPDYLKTVAANVRELKVLLGGDDMQPVRRLGHQMKGEGRAFGFGPISEMGHKLQMAAEDKDTVALQRVLRQLEDYLGRIEII